MKSFILHMITGLDNKTIDVVRVGMIASLLMFFGICITQLVQNHKIDLLQFAGGSTIILGGGAAGVKIKETTEPRQ
jgi:hypothetical protein